MQEKRKRVCVCLRDEREWVCFYATLLSTENSTKYNKQIKIM